MRKNSHFISYFENNDINNTTRPSINSYNVANLETFENDKHSTDEFFFNKYDASSINTAVDGHVS
jgi:hypothetical protein